MKKIIISGLLLLFFATVYAQQRPQYTQYMINPYVLNPAVAGIEDYIDIRAGYRNQWVGFSGAPRTFYLSGHTPIGRDKCINSRVKNTSGGYHGIGAYISGDKTGPSSRTTINISYAYHK